jgi:hypothetical protein
MKMVRRAFVLSLPLLLVGSSWGQDDVAILLRRVPKSSNALAVVRLDSLLKSPRGVREAWADNYKLGYLNGAVRIPPVVRTMIMASHYNADDPSASVTIAVALLNKNTRLSMEDIASREGGTIETIANKPVVRTSRGNFVVELDRGLMGAMHPASHQEMAGWIRFAERNLDPVLSPYLRRAVSEGRGAAIQLAIDLEDIVDPKAVHTWLPHSKALKGKQGTFKALEELIEGLQGVRFTARVEDTTTGEVLLDFTKSVGENAGYMKDLFLESLGEIGASLDDFSNCEVRTQNEGKTVVLRAELSDDTLREIMSLIQMPSTDPEEIKSPTYDQATAKGDLAATEQYYFAVQNMLNDLRKKSKKTDDYAKSALWHETYAKRISQLPRRGVDPEMLKYGADVTQKLYALASSLHGIPLQVDLLQNQAYFYSYTPPSIYLGRRWGPTLYTPTPTYTDTNVPEIRRQQEDAISKGQEDRQKIWQMLDSDMYKIRRQMSEKYKTNFDRPK